MNINCDIILPIKDNPADLRVCLESIIKYTEHPYRLILIDDGSDKYTKDFLESFIQKYKNTALITNPQNSGFVKSCNKGLAISEGDYVIILNSDTVVTPGWLAKMVRCAESDSRIGIVNPLSNFAANLSIEMPTGDNIFTAAEKIERLSKRLYPDIVTAVGFCFMITRNALNALGGFDEIYQQGYCEESDYCMRALARGFRVVACDDTFIYHKGRASFKDYERRYRENRRIFDKRWKRAYREALAKFKKSNPLRYIKESIYVKESHLSLFKAAKSDIILLLRGVRNYGWRYTFKKFLYHLRERDSISLIKLKELRKKKAKAIKDTNFALKNRLKITFILEELVVCGGVNFIIEIVNELILQNIDAKIAACYRTDYIKDFALYTQPIVFSDKRSLIKYFPHSDIVVATLWKTAYDVKEILNRNPRIKPFYFIQDSEARFYPEDKGTQAKVTATYDFINDKIVITQWLLNEFKKDGYRALRISPSINLDVFYPRNNGLACQNKRIVSMARPATPQRGFPDMIKAFKLIKETMPDAEIVFFGSENLNRYNIPFSYTNAGILMGNDLARLYSSCDVYLDSSLFHGFGRTGLEAMACGCACVLTDSGGVSEYAQDNYNCLMVPVGDTIKMADAIIRLLEDEELRKRLVQNGLETAKRFPVQNAASQLKEIFLSKI